MEAGSQKGDADKKKGERLTVRRKSFSNKEKQIWVIRGKKTKAKGNNRKRASLLQRKNENRKKKRRNKCPVLSGDLKASTEVEVETGSALDGTN